MVEFTVGSLYGSDALRPELVEGMFRLRYEVFHERLNWEVRTQNGIEVDEYDDRDAVYVVGFDQESKRVKASWRLRSTTRPYMLRDTFPQLLEDREAPATPSCWEVSRFAVDHRATGGEAGMMRFKSLTQTLFARSIQFGVERGIRQGIWVTTLGVERMARRLGYSLARRGTPQIVGCTTAVVQEIRIDDTSVALAESQLGYAFNPFNTYQEAA